MERLPRVVKHGLQETSDVSTALMHEEMQPSKAMKIKRISAKD